MKGAIAYSLFGYNKERQQNCFDFLSYIRGFLLNIRINRLLYPGWDTILETDNETYFGHVDLFVELRKIGVVINTNPEAPLTKAMLWRLKPVFDYTNYTHIICRDLDSPATYREAQAVEDWIRSGKCAHAITDSISHSVYLLGGMIGFVTKDWPTRTGWQHWTDMFNMSPYDFSKKGMDQTFLNEVIYPKYSNPSSASIMQHYVLGMGNTWLDGYKNCIPEIEVPGVDLEMKESNEICGHIGAAGYWPGPMFQFLQKHQGKFTDLLEIEKKFPTVAYWVNDGTFN